MHQARARNDERAAGDARALAGLTSDPRSFAMHRTLVVGVLILAVAQTTWTQQARTHDLALTPEHVHWGYYDSRVPPVLRIASGDRVRVETMIAGGLQRVRLAGAAETE